MKKLILAAVAALLLAGCSRHSLLVHVDAIAGPEAQQKKRYVLIPADANLANDALQYSEYAAYVNRIMVDAGFQPGASYDDADIAVLFSYKLSDPETVTWTESVPIIGQTGISSSTTYGTLSLYGSGGTFSSTTTHKPAYGVVGHRERTRRQTIYHRFMQLDAYDVAKFQADQSMVHVWKAAAVSTGTSSDLRRVLPYMAVAMKPHLGASSGHQKRVSVSPKDEYLTQLTGLPPKAFRDK